MWITEKVLTLRLKHVTVIYYSREKGGLHLNVFLGKYFGQEIEMSSNLIEQVVSNPGKVLGKLVLGAVVVTAITVLFGSGFVYNNRIKHEKTWSKRVENAKHKSLECGGARVIILPPDDELGKAMTIVVNGKSYSVKSTSDVVVSKVPSGLSMHEWHETGHTSVVFARDRKCP
jgi:hypothetical protein